MRWPVPELQRDGVRLRLLKMRDEAEWISLRNRNRDWLRPWEATAPPGAADTPVTFRTFIRKENAMWRSRRSFPMVIEKDGRLVGRVTLGRIEWGAERGGSLGYWVSQDQAGQGIAPTAVVLMCEYAFGQGLASHRSGDSSGERGVPVRRAQARSPRRGHEAVLPLHRWCLARSSNLCGHVSRAQVRRVVDRRLKYHVGLTRRAASREHGQGGRTVVSCHPQDSSRSSQLGLLSPMCCLSASGSDLTTRWCAPRTAIRPTCGSCGRRRRASLPRMCRAHRPRCRCS